MLIGHFVENAARHEPDRVAVQFGAHRLTYGALRDRCALLAEALERTGRAPRVALLADNRPEANELHVGVPMAGGTLTFVNQRLGTEEITYVLDHSETTILVVGPGHLHRVPALRAAVPRLTTVVGLGIEVGADTEHPDVDLGYEALLATAGGEGPRAAVSPQDTAWIVYTSGTTGRPKGVMVSHRNLTASVANLVLGVGHERHMRQAQPFPQSHITSYSELGCYAVAGTYHLMASFDPAGYLHLIERERITATSMAPAMLGILLAREDLSGVDVSSVRRISYGASGISPTLLRRAMARFANAGFYQGFGMTELAGNAAWLDEETHRAGAADRPDLLTRAARSPASGSSTSRGTTGRPASPGRSRCAGTR
jgi:acyl-CoA synthetase (AMP-forming)/AMP-acid ligase II